jgi:dephospho-CoA kinase
MFNGKPIIGLAGGIGSGKSFVARRFAEMGCHVINSDELVHAAYDDPAVRAAVGRRWGKGVIKVDGTVDRRAVGEIVFSDAGERSWLESLLHPLVDRIRDEQMLRNISSAIAFVWDSPLLFETGLDGRCDRVVFIEAPLAERLQRVASRGWDAAELARREKNQWPLDKKRALSHDVIQNTADAAQTRDQVDRLLSQILLSSVSVEESTHPPGGTEQGPSKRAR